MPNQMLNFDDNSLVIALRKGDREAFSKLYHHHVPKLYNHILRICKSLELTEDIVQETFVKVWEKRENLDENLSFQSYLFTIARNNVLNVIKRAALQEDIYDELVANANRQYNNAEEEMSFKETSLVLNAAIDNLPPRKKKIFELCKNEGMTYAEVATQLGIAKGTVNVQIVSALKSIDHYLTNNGISNIILLLPLLFKNFFLSYICS